MGCVRYDPHACWLGNLGQFDERAGRIVFTRTPDDFRQAYGIDLQ